MANGSITVVINPATGRPQIMRSQRQGEKWSRAQPVD